MYEPISTSVGDGTIVRFPATERNEYHQLIKSSHLRSRRSMELLKLNDGIVLIGTQCGSIAHMIVYTQSKPYES
jgi:hypothetical protein